MIYIWGHREYPPVRFEYKTASERYLPAKICAKQFWVFSKTSTKFVQKLRELNKVKHNYNYPKEKKQGQTTPCGAIWGQTWPYMIKQDLTGVCRTIQDQMWPFMNLRGHTGPYRASWDHTGPHRTIRPTQKYTGPYKTIQYHMGQ